MKGRGRRLPSDIKPKRSKSGYLTHPPPRVDPSRVDNKTSRHEKKAEPPALFTAQRIPKPLLLVFLMFSVNFIWLVLLSGDSFESENKFIYPSEAGGRGRQTMRPPKSGMPFNESSVLVVIVSNRFSGILPAVSSILTHTKSKGIDLVLIGDTGVNSRVEKHFGQHHPKGRSRLQSFTALTLHDIQTDLEEQGYKPIWTWPSWGVSRRDKHWQQAETTLHVADWDNLPTHAHELNHLRFYLPHVSMFRRYKLLYFLDDDILVRKDLGEIAQQTLNTLDSSMGMVTPCNIWIWDTSCQTFSFKDENTIGTILEMPSLYGDRATCKLPTERHCYPGSYPAFLRSVLPKNVAQPEDQKAWNFGFTLMALDNWRELKLTEQYEAVMRESYRKHVFPETSLTFGLGAAYIALAGAVACWDDSIVAVRDGFAFIEYDRYAKQFGSNFMNTSVDVIHYTGPHKPWAPNTTIDTLSLDPWLHYMRQERMPVPDQLPSEPTTDVFLVLASDRAGAGWLMSELDRHPLICASGEYGKPESGFPSDVLLPSGLDWLPRCSIKRPCSLEFIENAVLDLRDTMDRRGRTAVVPLRCQHQRPASDPLGDNLGRICNFVEALKGHITEDAIESLWVDAFRREDSNLLGCSCQKGSQVKGLKVLMEWLLNNEFPEESTEPAPLNLTSFRQSKIIRLQRRNLFERHMSTLLANKSGLYHPRTYEEKVLQLKKAGNLTVPIEGMLKALAKMEAVDKEADRWAHAVGSVTLEVDFDDCRADILACWDRIHAFLEVEPLSRTKPRKQRSYSRPPFARTVMQIANLDEVKSALAKNGYRKFLAPS